MLAASLKGRVEINDDCPCCGTQCVSQDMLADLLGLDAHDTAEFFMALADAYDSADMVHLFGRA